MKNVNDIYPVNHYTVESAMAAKDRGKLKEWVHELLLSEKSFDLAEIIISEKTVAIEMLDFPLSLLKKIQGPEEEEIHRQSPEIWEDKVKKLTDSVRGGYAPAPLIVTDFWNYFEIADGNHRHEALERKGIKSYWTIFFIKHEKGREYLSDVMKNI